MFFGATAFAEAPFSAEGIINQTVEVTGVQADTAISSVSVQAEASVTLDTNLLTITLGDEQVTANADISLDTNLLTTASGNVSFYLDETIYLSTNLIQTAVDSVTIEAGGNIFIAAGAEAELLTTVNNVEIEIKFDEYVTGQQLNSTVNSVDAQAISLIDVTGVLLSTTVTSVTVTAGANVEVSTNLLTVSLGDEQTTANANVDVTTNLLQSTTDSVSVRIDNEVFLTALTPLNTTTGTVVISIGVELVGIQMTSNVGKVFIDAWAVVNINATNTWTVVDIAA
jgi:hypothetical protein